MWVRNTAALTMFAGLSQAHQMELAQTKSISLFTADEDTKLEICKYSFANLKHWLTTGETLVPPQSFNELGSFPVYVTWKKFIEAETLEDDHQTVLRGC